MTDDTTLTVTDLTQYIKEAVEEQFQGVRVGGEVANLTRAASGHVYFSLKDPGATLRCVMFRGFALRLKFDPRNGMEVVARGGLSVYPARGEYQLLVEELSPKGVGVAELAFRQLKEKLMLRGYFRPERKRPLPRFPRRVALVASPTGAAVRDMLEILATRWPAADVVVRPSRVQGAGAAEELAAAVRQLNRAHARHGLHLCAIVLGRGGGSSEDLAAFNTEVVADAVFESAVPVVSAVGHEVDVSLADMVAVYRALTPSQAIVALTPDRAELLDLLRDTADRLGEAVGQRITAARERLDLLAARPVVRRPLDRVRQMEQQLDQAAARLGRAAGVGLERRDLRVAAAAERLQGLSPLNVLARGYSLTRSAGSERLIRSAGDVAPGDAITTRVADGDITSRVERVDRAGGS